MKRLKKILVYAGSAGINDPAILRAAVLAKNNRATVELVDVIEEIPAYVRMVTPPTWDVPGLIAAEREKCLQDLADSLRQDGIDASTRVLIGKPPVAITQHVLVGEHDLVLKTARPEVFSQRLWYGTLAKRLMRICPCPVWIIQPHQPRRLQRIVAAIDPDDADEEKTELHKKIVEMASSLAKQEESELHIIHAWSVYGETLMQKRMPPEKLAQYAEDCATAARQRVDRFLSPFGGLYSRTKLHLLKGEPEDALIDFVDKYSVDLVVMGTVCRTGVYGYLIGNTAEKVLRHIGSSVLAVKPAGFQSPITVSADQRA